MTSIYPKLKNGSAISLSIYLMALGCLSSCYWINPPNSEESGSIELSSEEISGEQYLYHVFLIDSSKTQSGYGFSISLNSREIIRQRFGDIGGEITKLNTEQEAIQAAITTISNLKNNITAKNNGSQVEANDENNNGN